MDERICELPDGYRPLESEEFMNNLQREYFRRRLVGWRDELQKNNGDVIEQLQSDGETCTDTADRASTETELTYELRSKERAYKLIRKIDEALSRIKNGNYGYCEETGEPISLKRLEARPVAMLGIEAQERHEKRERVKKDD
ncbi:MAG: RNA polymerase-binding protein DksA [Holosporaceae bacterium]|jgi:DnaK suppressor protein|nr:RNA polymerase-binding protein DksA [Holosporaceae bacterium]